MGTSFFRARDPPPTDEEIAAAAVGNVDLYKKRLEREVVATLQKELNVVHLVDANSWRTSVYLPVRKGLTTEFVEEVLACHQFPTAGVEKVSFSGLRVLIADSLLTQVKNQMEQAKQDVATKKRAEKLKTTMYFEKRRNEAKRELFRLAKKGVYTYRQNWYCRTDSAIDRAVKWYQEQLEGTKIEAKRRYSTIIWTVQVPV